MLVVLFACPTSCATSCAPCEPRAGRDRLAAYPHRLMAQPNRGNQRRLTRFETLHRHPYKLSRLPAAPRHLPAGTPKQEEKKVLINREKDKRRMTDVLTGAVAVLWMCCGSAVAVLWLCCGCAVAVL